MSALSLHIPGIAGHTYAVLGLGRSGAATAETLIRSGARVLAWDDSETARAGVPADILVDLTARDLAEITALVMSPGIPFTHPTPHPVVMAAKAASKPIISDIELLAMAQPQARFVCVTGTNGKSTTTTLIAHVLKSAGREVEVGGNLGQAALSLAPVGSEGIYVLELSSYQLDITPTPIADIALLLNITPDHLDRHGGMQGYIAAKAQILRAKGRSSIGIIGQDDESCRQLFARLRSSERRLIPISVETAQAKGVYVDKSGQLIDALQGSPQIILDLKTIARLPGKHNWQNAVAAYVVAKALGLSAAEIITGFKSYPGLAHRQELIAHVNGISYINDSKATNADAAEKALACYDNIYWILGGKAKDGGLAGLEPCYPRIRHGFLIGEAAPAFFKQINRAFPTSICGTLDKAVSEAHNLAQREKKPGAVVLLSPACASFDQYANFEVRGNHFRALVEQVLGARGAA